MAVALARQHAETTAFAVPHTVALLRMAALACRAGPRAPCAARLPADAGAEVRARALAAFLPEALDRRPVLWRPGATDLSFDERWLVAYCTAIATGDGDSERFLTGRRVRAERRGELRALGLSLLKALDIY